MSILVLEVFGKVSQGTGGDVYDILHGANFKTPTLDGGVERPDSGRDSGSSLNVNQVKEGVKDMNNKSFLPVTLFGFRSLVYSASVPSVCHRAL